MPYTWLIFSSILETTKKIKKINKSRTEPKKYKNFWKIKKYSINNKKLLLYFHTNLVIIILFLFKDIDMKYFPTATDTKWDIIPFRSLYLLITITSETEVLKKDSVPQ